jgi:hypothetical protein
MLDLYCERTSASLFGEPLNAVTNLAYFAAAWAVWRLRTPSPSTAAVLSSLLAAVGVGSLLFHTLATPWARILDRLPILLFQLAFLWLYGTRIVKIASLPMAALLTGFLIAVWAGARSPDFLNGSLIYAPALGLALGISVLHYRTQSHGRLTLPAAVGIFIAAVIFRTVDHAVCQTVPIGTHFLWHLLTAVALCLLARGLVLNLPAPRRAE